MKKESHPVPQEDPSISYEIVAHRAYNSVKPSCNRYLAKKWDDASRERHLERLQTIASRIDNRPPNKYKHLEMPSRRLRMEEERQFKIERENQLLLQKMIRILKQTPQWFDESVEKRITDNRKKSVEDRRKQESERIATENRKLIQRLQQKNGFYTHRQWEENREKELQYLRNISAYPLRYLDKNFEEKERRALKLKRLGVTLDFPELLMRMEKQDATASKPQDADSSYAEHQIQASS